MTEEDFAAVKAETIFSLVLNAVAAAFLILPFVLGIPGAVFYAIWPIVILLPIPCLIFNIRNKRKCNDAVYYKLSGAGCMSKLCVLNIVLSVIMLLIAVGGIYLLYYIGSHF